MKKLLLIPILMRTFEASSLAGWFSNDHEQALQQQLQHEQKKSSVLTGIVFVLGAGSIVTLVVGTIIGSKTRRDSHEN